MKKTFFTFAVAVGVVAAAFWGCDKQNVAIPGISNVSVSDCHFPDPDRLSKSSDEDSIAVSWVIGIPNSMIITHYNMDLDCGSDNRIVTMVEMAGDVVTVTEHVGEQGMTDCFCFYDNTFQIDNLPRTPFTLVVQVESVFMDNLPETAIVYQQQF